MFSGVCEKIVEFAEKGNASNATEGAAYVGISVAKYKVITRMYVRKARKNFEGAIKDFKRDLFL